MLRNLTGFEDDYKLTIMQPVSIQADFVLTFCPYKSLDNIFNLLAY